MIFGRLSRLLCPLVILGMQGACLRLHTTVTSPEEHTLALCRRDAAALPSADLSLEILSATPSGSRQVSALPALARLPLRFATTVVVEVKNQGSLPVALTELEVRGLATGRRVLAIPEPPLLRVFGTLPPGESVQYRLGISFPVAGRGEARLVAHLRSLCSKQRLASLCQAPTGSTPPTKGLSREARSRCLAEGLRAMEELRLPMEGERSTLELSWPIEVLATELSEEEALARAGREAQPKSLRYSQVLEGYFVQTSATRLLIRVGETLEIPGLRPEALHLIEKDTKGTFWINEEGSAIWIDGRAALRQRIEAALRQGKTIDVTRSEAQAEALHAY